MVITSTPEVIKFYIESYILIITIHVQIMKWWGGAFGQKQDQPEKLIQFGS